MTNETKRFFFPLKIISYPQYDCSENALEDISPKEAVSYEDQIIAAIAKENWRFPNERGLAGYLDTDTLREKVRSLHPFVEVWNGELWGVMTAHVNGELTQEETAGLISEVEGQNSNDWGEVFEQRPIKTPDGEIYISFWNSDGGYFIKPEQELKQTSPNLGYGGPVMGGM